MTFAGINSPQAETFRNPHRCVQIGRLAQQRHDFYLLDELTYPVKWGWVNVGDVVATLTGRPGTQHVVITGRDAPQELLDVADLVTEMTLVTHPFRSGIKVQPGVEF